MNVLLVKTFSRNESKFPHSLYVCGQPNEFFHKVNSQTENAPLKHPADILLVKHDSIFIQRKCVAVMISDFTLLLESNFQNKC